MDRGAYNKSSQQNSQQLQELRALKAELKRVKKNYADLQNRITEVVEAYDKVRSDAMKLANAHDGTEDAINVLKTIKTIDKAVFKRGEVKETKTDE